HDGGRRQRRRARRIGNHGRVRVSGGDLHVVRPSRAVGGAGGGRAGARRGGRVPQGGRAAGIRASALLHRGNAGQREGRRAVDDGGDVGRGGAAPQVQRGVLRPRLHRHVDPDLLGKALAEIEQRQDQPQQER